MTPTCERCKQRPPRPRNYWKMNDWEKHQSPLADGGPWLKVYSGLILLPKWKRLSAAERGLLVSMWVYCSASGQHVPADSLASALCLPRYSSLTVNIERLQKLGWISRTRSKLILRGEREEKRENPQKDSSPNGNRSGTQARVEAIRTPEKIEKWKAAFPYVDSGAECRRAALWLEDNPSRRPKSKQGLSSFLTRWMNRTNERCVRARGGVEEPVRVKATEEQVNARVIQMRRERGL